MHNSKPCADMYLAFIRFILAHGLVHLVFDMSVTERYLAAQARPHPKPIAA